MATYKYEAISKSGVNVNGVIKATSTNDAIVKLKAEHSVINKIKEVEETPEFLANLFKEKIKLKELSLVCKQFAIILSAGLPIVKSVSLVASQTTDKALHKLLEEVGEDVKGGLPLADSFAKRDSSLPTTFIESIRAGETSGKLAQTFERLSSYLSKRDKIRSKVISSLMYPAFVIVVAVVVVFILMVVAIPMFTEMFAELGSDLPLPTKIMIACSDFFRNWTWLLVLIGIGLWIAYKAYQKTEEGHYNIDKIKLKLPVLGKVNLMDGASQFANTFSSLLASGIPAVKALTITGRAMTNYKMGRDILDAVRDVEGGRRIGESLRKNCNLPDLLIEITAVGEESGSMEDALTTIAEYFDNEVETTTSRAISVLEPTIIVFLAIVVVIILLAVYMPVFSIYGSM